ncbi:MAG: hypothetical protein PVG14_01850 [Anaerolineales bacterium]
MSKRSKETHPKKGANSWLKLLRVTWVVVNILILVLLIVGIPTRFELLMQAPDERILEDLGIEASTYAAYTISINLAIALAHQAIAVVIFWRKPKEWMALLVAFALVTNGAIIPLSVLYPPESTQPLVSLLVNLVISIGLISSVYTLYLFPNGRPVPLWTRYLGVAWILFALVFPHTAPRFSAWSFSLQFLTVAIMLVWSFAGLYAQLYRYQNVSSAIQRQQTKWGVLGLVAAVLGPFQYVLPFVVLPTLRRVEVPNILYNRLGASFFTSSFLFGIGGTTILRLATILFPLSFAVAILRYRLWDIDLIIRRTLTYSTLSLLLALVYFGSILLLQNVFSSMSNQQSPIAIVLSTLTIAALFNPLRHRVQDFIDRRFYRAKYDAERTLARFAATAREELDLEQLSTALLGVVEETMQPEHGSLWLRSITEGQKTHPPEEK